MATEALSAQTATRSGEEMTVNAVTAADGFTFPNDGHTLIICVNDANDCELVFTIQKTLDGETATKTIDVDDGETWVLGPFPVELYNDADGLVTCTPEQDLTGTTEGIAVISF